MKKKIIYSAQRLFIVELNGVWYDNGCSRIQPRRSFPFSDGKSAFHTSDSGYR